MWIDAGSLWPHPYTIYVPCYATWTQVRSRIYLPLSDDVVVTVNGITWDGSRHFFANAFVIQVRSSTDALRTRSLLSFADRLEGLLALQCNCDGPVTANWDALPRGEQRRLFREHFRNWFQCARTFTVSTFPFAQVLLLVQGTGVFRFTVETRLPPSVLQVQEQFDAFLAPRIGNGVVEDLKFVWGEDNLFVVRLPEVCGAYWIHLDGDLVDTWELDPSQNLSQVPTRPGHVLYPTDPAGDFGYVVAQPIAEADTQPGPSRLRGVPPIPPTVRAELDFLEAQSSEGSTVRRMHSVFGTSPSSRYSSLHSSELAALEHSGEDSAATVTTSSTSSSSTAALSGTVPLRHH